jgi:hypothetical protein
MKLSRLLRRLFLSFMLHADSDDTAGGNGERQTDEQIKQAIEERNSARLAMYEQIADSNDEARAAEFEEIPDDAHARFQQDDAAGAQNAAATQTDEPAAEKIALKVNGKVIELPLEEVIARAQMVESAHDYLEQAKRIRLDAAHSTQAAPKPDAPAKPVEDDLALVRAIQMGSEEEAAQAIRQLRSPTIDLPKLIDERMSFQQAVSRFQTEFKDVFDDPYLRQIALNRDAELVAQGDARPYWDRYESVGNEIRQWVGGVRKTSTEPDKRQRKASVTQLPAAASRVSAQTQEEPDESVSDVIAQMARTRGQVR